MLSRKTIYFGVLATLLSLLFVVNGSLPGQDASESEPAAAEGTGGMGMGGMEFDGEGMYGDGGMSGMGGYGGMEDDYGGEPVTKAQIEEILTSTGPREPHDVWLNKIQRADAWMDHRTQVGVALYREAKTDERRATLKTQIEELSKKHFVIRQEGRVLEVLRLEERLAQIRAAIAKRNESKDLIVRVRVSALLGEIEWDDWSLPRRGGGSGPAGMMSGGMGGMDGMSDYGGMEGGYGGGMGGGSAPSRR